MAFNTKAYELLTVPAHLWLWVAGRLCGGRFTCGPVDDDQHDSVEVESAQLRKALQRISWLAESCSQDEINHETDMIEQMEQIALAALKEPN